MRALMVARVLSGAEGLRRCFARLPRARDARAHLSQDSFRAGDARAHVRKFPSGRAMRAPMFASYVPGAQCVRPRSQVVLPSVASSGRRAREKRAVASRKGWGLPRGGCSRRARARPRSSYSRGKRWAETPFGEASFVRVPAVPRLRTMVCAARGGRVQRGIAPGPRAMFWHV